MTHIWTFLSLLFLLATNNPVHSWSFPPHTLTKSPLPSTSLCSYSSSRKPSLYKVSLTAKAKSTSTTLNVPAPLKMSKSEEEMEKQKEVTTQVGSKEYYQGFVSRGVNDEPIERVSGDKLLGPILKFTGGASVIILAFFILFLASNDLLSIP